MTITQLVQQLSQLSETLKATNNLITRLSKLSFQPGSEPLDSEKTVRVELAQDIHDSLKQLEEDLDLLKQEAEDLSGESGPHKRRDSERDREGARLSAQVVRLGEDLKHSRGHFRRAQLVAKRASETAKQRERELVLASLQAVPEPSTASADNPASRELLFAGRRKAPQSTLSKDELLVSASSDVTSALRRTHNLLAAELSRSRFAQETFDQSTAALADLGEHYGKLDTILTNSRNLLGTLLRSQKSDTWYLETAFYVLLATLCWLFFRRILFGPFVKLPLFVWNAFALLVKWVLLKPLYFLLVASGVITTRPVSAAAGRSTALTSSSSRPPLIVQPSAKGGPPKFAMPPKGGVPAGAGGAGAKVGKDAALEGKMSEEIAQMASRSLEQQQQQQQQQGSQDDSEKELPIRGDGTVLQARGNLPKNPKKKVFEAGGEEEGQPAHRRDEL